MHISHRSLLSILNTSNPFIVSMPLEDMYYVMTWKQLNKDKSSGKKEATPTETETGKGKGKSKRSAGKKISFVDDKDDEVEADTRKTLGEVSDKAMLIALFSPYRRYTLCR